MQLRFSKQGVQELLDHTLNSTSHMNPYGKDDSKVGAAILLVGDDGVYLMSNGKPGLMLDEKLHKVVYAEECNPKMMEFDDWWDAKKNSFGGDGVIFLDAESLSPALDYPGDYVIIEMEPSAKEFSVLFA